MLFFNIVIPTCDRPDTLKYSIKACLDQDYPYFKVYVMDNFNEQSTLDVIDELKCEKLVHLRAPKRLQMKDNFEYALQFIKEGYVIYIGDDDGLVKDSLKYAAEIISRTNTLALKSFHTMYRWPGLNEIIGENTRAVISTDDSFISINSKEFLYEMSQKLNFNPDGFYTPSVYHSFIEVNLMKDIVTNYGDYFYKAAAPDVYSAIANLGLLEKYVISFIPILINGTSIKSTGLSAEITIFNQKAQEKFNDNKKITENFVKDLKTHPELDIEDPLNCIFLPLNITDTFLYARDRNNLVPKPKIEDIIYALIKVIYPYTDQIKKPRIIDHCNMLAKKYNLESYLKELLNSSPENFFEGNTFDSKPAFEHRDYKKRLYLDLQNTDIKNVYEVNDVFINLMQDKKPYNKNLDVFLSNDNSIHFKNSIKKEASTFTNSNELELEVKNIYNDLNLQIIYDSYFTNIKSNYYLILRKDLFLGDLNEKDINKLNKIIDRIWAKSSFEKELYISSGFYEEKIDIIPIGIDFNYYNSEKDTIPLNTKKKFKFLYFGNCEEKILNDLLKEYKSYFTKDDDVCLVIKYNFLAKNTDLDKIKKIINEYNKSDSPEILFIDYFMPRDISKLYKSCNIFVYPHNKEVFSEHILEAASSGLPIITYACGGIIDFCDDKNSYLINFDDNDNKLSDSLGNIMKQYYLGKLNKLDLNYTKEKLNKMYSWDNIFLKIEESLEKIKNKPILRENFNVILDDYFKEAIYFYEQKEYYKAERIFYILTTLDDSNINYYKYMGFSLFNQQKYDDAINYFSEVINLDVLDHDVIKSIIFILEKQGDFETAEEYKQLI